MSGPTPAGPAPAGGVAPRDGFRRTVLLVAALNLGYFGIEFALAFAIGSVSLVADSIDFLEDTSINLLIAVALDWSVAKRAHTGRALAGVLLVPALSALWMAWSKLSDPVPPGAFVLSLTGLGALAVNLGCALLLARHRHRAGSLSRAAWLSARNDVVANVAIIGAGGLTAWTLSMWPDLVVGLGIGAINADAAREVWRAAGREHLHAEP